MEKRKIYRGKWAGLSAATIAKLIGCSETKAKKILKTKQFEDIISLEVIGDLIYEERTKLQESKLSYHLDKHLDRWPILN